MVSAKPIEFTIVSAVPLVVAAVFCATKVENIGESEMTTIPQNNKKVKNTKVFDVKNKGETIQQIPDKSKAVFATFLLPKRSDKFPPTIHPKLPMASIKNDQSAMLISAEIF